MIKLEYKRNDSAKWEHVECLSFGFNDVGIKYYLDGTGITHHLLYSEIKEWKAAGKTSKAQVDSCEKVMAG